MDAALLSVPRPSTALLALVQGLHPDVRTSFWERMVPMLADPDTRPLAVPKLIEHGRSWAAIGVLVAMLPGNATTGPSLNVDLAESALLSAASGLSGGAPPAASLSWGHGTLLDHLERRRTTDPRTSGTKAPLIHSSGEVARATASPMRSGSRRG